MRRGQLRVYLGAAPGVGKTYAMLNEGWRRAQRGTDVVVGYVETHGRANTLAQVRDLEVVPRRTLTYRGQRFEEMDIDAILERKPAVALVDEIAHTNVPGSRNTKRYQDIDELLDAGIDVISTVNIQHFESLNDVVEDITGIKQRETVPDAFVRSAEQVEFVDQTPEALRRRMAHGNIYAAEKVDAALGNYFRVGNLAALRELGLLWIADRVDEALTEYREQHGIAKPWETRERVVVALTGAPGGDDLIRRAARMAMRTRGDLVGVHVLSDEGLVGHATNRLIAHRELLGELGGRYVEVQGADVASALVSTARNENATQLVLGASRRSRWTELTRGSIVNRVIRDAGGAIDVHVISTDVGNERDSALVRPKLRLAPISRTRQGVAFALAVFGLPALTFALTRIRDSLGLQNALLIYLLFVVAIATIGGLLPAVLASLMAFALLNWFFAPPIHTWTITNTRDVLALVSFIVVAGVISALVDLATRRRQDAYRARAEAEALATMSGTVLLDPEPLPKLVEELTERFRLDGVSILTATADEGWVVEAAAGTSPPTTPPETDHLLELPDHSILAWSGGNLGPEDRETIGAFATQVALALVGRRLQNEAAGAAALSKANELRTALLAAVSHDLRTPLASIRAAATSLLADDVDWDRAAVKELLQTIDDEAERLNTLVGNLLDMSRLQTGTFSINARHVGLDEVVASALVGLHAPPERIYTDVPETLPTVVVDPTLLERAVANLIDNALSFSPLDRPVRVEAGVVNETVHLRVIDEGPGIPQHDRERIFQPFQRAGDKPNGEGVGLGLAVAKGFVEAIGGDLDVEDTPGGGTTMVITIPLDEP